MQDTTEKDTPFLEFVKGEVEQSMIDKIADTYFTGTDEQSELAREAFKSFYSSTDLEGIEILIERFCKIMKERIAAKKNLDEMILSVPHGMHFACLPDFKDRSENIHTDEEGLVSRLEDISKWMYGRMF